MVTRAVPTYIDLALFVISELKQVGVDATLKQIEWAYGLVERLPQVSNQILNVFHTN